MLRLRFRRSIYLSYPVVFSHSNPCTLPYQYHHLRLHLEFQTWYLFAKVELIVSVADTTFRSAVNEDRPKTASRTELAPETEVVDDEMTSSKARHLENVDQIPASTTETVPEPEMEDDGEKSSNSKKDSSIQLKNVVHSQQRVTEEPHSRKHKW